MTARGGNTHVHNSAESIYQTEHPFRLSLYLSTGYPLRTLCGEKYREEEEEEGEKESVKRKEKKMPSETITIN